MTAQETNQNDLRESLIQQIQSAFADVIFQSITLFDDPTWQLQGKHWREVPLAMLQRDGFIFSLPVSSDGQFFLPAFMVALLTNQEGMEEYINSFLIIFQWASERWEGYETIPFSNLNKQQKMTVLALLEAYPSLFPPLFELKTYPPEVKATMSALMPETSRTDFFAPYELWEEAITFWRSDVQK